MARLCWHIHLGFFLLLPLILLGDSGRVDSLRHAFHDPSTPSTEQIELAFMLAEQFRNHKALDSALAYAETGIFLSEQAGEDHRVQFYDLVGQVHFQNKYYLLASQLFHKGAMLAQESGDPLKIAHLNNALGLIHVKFGAYDRAEKAFRTTLKILQEVGPQKKALSIQKNLMHLYLLTDREEVALVLGREIYEAALEQGFYRLACRVRLLEAKHLFQGNSYTAARSSLKDAIRIAQDHNFIEEIQASLLDARMYAHEGNAAEAVVQLSLAMDQVVARRQQGQVAEVYQAYGDVYALSNQDALAMDAYKQAYAHMDSVHLEERKELLEQMSELSRKVGRIFEADSLAQAAGILREQLYEQQRQYRMNELEKGADFDGHISRWEAQDLADRKHQQYLWLGIAGTLTLLMVMSWFYFLGRRRARIHPEANKQQSAIVTQNKRLAEANRQLESFVSMLSHDFKAPLRTILTQLLFLSKEDEKEKQATYFDNIRKTALRMDELINHVLVLIRVGKHDMPKVDIDLNVLMKEVIQDLSGEIERSNGQVIFQNLPTLSGYQAEVRSLFQNLILNGLKFSRPGVPPIVEVSSEISDTYWRVFVKDNGIGLNPDHLVEALKPSRRVHEEPDLYPGSGMGLAICKQVCEVHGWELGVEAMDGGGAGFWVSLEKGPF